jgi:gamma-glutamylcyclotransferase (GGCT)/AIG2-like uncharacterized protein YtfP
MLPLFVYGTLQIPAIMQTVTGRRYAVRSAMLTGYAAWSLRDVAYPGLCPAARHRTPGLVLNGLDARALRRLDRHEGVEYRRLPVWVRLNSGGLVRAQAYLLQPSEYHRIRRHVWHLTAFIAQELAAYTPCDGR